MGEGYCFQNISLQLQTRPAPSPSPSPECRAQRSKRRCTRHSGLLVIAVYMLHIFRITATTTMVLLYLRQQLIFLGKSNLIIVQWIHSWHRHFSLLIFPFLRKDANLLAYVLFVLTYLNFLQCFEIFLFWMFWKDFIFVLYFIFIWFWIYLNPIGVILSLIKNVHNMYFICFLNQFWLTCYVLF